MKNKLFLLGAIVTGLTCQLFANQLHPNMPSGNRPCYPSTKCTGDPNLIGRNRGGGCPGNMNNNMNGNRPYSYGSEQGYPQDNTGYGAPTGKVLQTDSAQKFTGVIRSINRVNLPDQIQIQIVLSTDQGDILVIAGPANYIDQQKIMFKVGDKIEVKGYRIRANGNEVITAAQIKKNGSTIELLNDRRQPMWGSRSY